MCPIVDGMAVNASNTNTQLLDAVGDDTALGIITLANTATATGSTVTNIQREQNALWSFIGGLLNQVKTYVPTWTNNNFGTSADPVKTKIEAIDAAFNPATGAHARRAARLALGNGVATASVTFSSAWADINYIEVVTITNTVDASPIFIQGVVTSRSTTGFTVTFNAPTDSVNYFLNYTVSKAL